MRYPRASLGDNLAGLLNARLDASLPGELLCSVMRVTAGAMELFE